MPVKFGLWRVEGESVAQVPPSGISSEERLEDILEQRIEILGLGELFQIGRQVITDIGKRIDILAIDELGDLYVIELKKDRTLRICPSRTFASFTQSTTMARTSTQHSPATSRRSRVELLYDRASRNWRVVHKAYQRG